MQGKLRRKQVAFNTPLLTLTVYLRISILPGCCRNRLPCVVAQVVHCTALGEGKMAPPRGACPSDNLRDSSPPLVLAGRLGIPYLIEHT